MPNKGFIPSAATFIRQIRQNLSEGRYAIGDTGFPIIKELVQNADDASAEVLHIGISEPLAGAEHPLLQSPGMFVINNGKFDRNDSANIRRFGENTKSMDAAKIGKFGLGLKSIFHLCEAFFFLGHTADDEGDTFVADILNPWSDQTDSFHPEWDDFTDGDKTLLFNSLLKHFGDRKCFCLWIPLRQRAQVQGSEAVIKFFPGDSLPAWLSTSELAPEIGKLVPMLENLRSIHGWRGIGEHATQEFSISLTDDSRRRRDFDDLDAATPTTFQGAIHVQQMPNTNCIVEFAGTELNPFDEGLDDLEGDEHWPSDLGRDPKTGNPRNIREKARQHSAVCASFRRASEAPGSLSISWAVFLPLGEPEVLPIPGTNVDFSLHLHGYFFVDAGRNRPIGLHETREAHDELRDDEQLRHAWNQRLADVGTLPLLPRSLKAVSGVADCGLTDDELCGVTGAIESSSFFAEFGNQICSTQNWVYVLNSDRSRSWQLSDAHEGVVELPESPDHALPFEVFPALTAVVETVNVTAVNCPRLLNETANQLWDSNHLTELIQSIEPRELLKSPKRCNYLGDFLSLLADNELLDTQSRELTTICRRGLAECGIDKPKEYGVDLRRVLSSIPSNCRVPLSLPDALADILLRELNGHDVNVVFVPVEIDSVESPGCAQLQPDDAANILKGLAERQNRTDDAQEREAVSILAAQLLSRVKNRSEALTAVADLRLFTGKDCRNKQDTLVTWSDLQQHRDMLTLFATPSPRAYSLQKAISNESVLLISKECFEAILPSEAPSQCTQGRIVDVLARSETPMLSRPGNRTELLKTLVGFRPDVGQYDAYRRSVRYLFHAFPSEFNSSAPLLISGNGSSDIWRRITHTSLSGQESEWRLLDPAFSSLLSGEHHEAFSIQPVGSESAIPLIVEIGPDAFSELRPSPTEYSELLKEINDDELCKQLPIHQDVGDNFVVIDASTYWESDVDLPNELDRSVTILCRSRDEATWRRQCDLARPLDATAVVEIVLQHDDFSPYWSTVMDSLQQASGLTSESLGQLTSRSWLPRPDGSSIAPVDVIDLPKIANEVAHVVTDLPGIFFEPGMLSDAILKHSSYDSMKCQFFPNTETALSMLGELLIEDEQNRIGPIRDAVFDEWKAIASGMPIQLLPCGELLEFAAAHYSSSTRRIFEQLTKHEITSERVSGFLSHLRQSHETERNARRRGNLLSVFNEYLRLLIQSSGYASTLIEQQLLNADGDWTLATELCCTNDGIAGSNVVDHSIEEVLAPSLPANLVDSGISSSFSGIEDGREPDWATVQPELDAAGSRLKQYFEPWRDIVPNEQIGGFLTLLGDDPEVVDLACQYLGKNRTVEETRIKFGLPEMKVGNTMEDGPTMMSKQRIVVEIVTDAKVEVVNLLGKRILVPRNMTPKNIFVGYGKRHYPFPHTTINGTYVLCFRLNEISPRDQTEADLSRLLKDSAVQFIVNAYNSYEHQTSFASAWDELSESDQLDISIAQERIIEHGFLILDQLGMRSDPQVAAILDKWDAADRLLAEQRSGTENRSGVTRRNPDVELRETKNALRDVLENNQDVQTRILEAIKLRVSEYYQYTKAAVPFEIFQNADDASIEFVDNWAVSEDERKDSTIFHVAKDADCLTMAHFGRRINQYPLEKRDASMGFDNDLWKMLVLSLSNKLQAEDDDSRCVTGKFGLGFKSSYLICDRPQLLSGRLAFEVTGAMYPRRLIAEERQKLDRCRTELVDSRTQSTIVQLPLNSVTADEVLADFLSLAHLAVVFARQIKHCILNGGECEARWEPTPVSAVHNCHTGTLSPLRTQDETGRLATRALLLESDHGSILFAVDSRSLDYFDDEVPTIWVTAPTREFMELGFLVNGPFALDVGRAQLAREFAQNSETAAKLGTELGKQLCELFEVTASEDGWKTLVKELRLASDANVYDFWDSLFRLIGSGIATRTQRDTPADALIRELFWSDDDRAAARLYQTCQAIPTRMRGKYRRLVSASQIKYAIDGLLADEPELFAEMSNWEVFQKHAPSGKVVSNAHVFEALRRLDSTSGFSVSHVETLNIATVLGWEFKYGSYAKPEDATRIGTTITKKTLELMPDSAEYRAVRDHLDHVQFKGRDNRFHPAKELLIGHETDLERDDRREDERFRAQFAPADRVLSDEYEGAGMAFFDVCRDTLEAPARVMFEWVVGATDLPHQVAALKYLARGELATALLLELKRRGFEGTWIADLASSTAFRSLDESTRNRLLDLLPKDGRPITDWDSFFGDEQIDEPVDAEDVLTAIHDWWGENRTCPQEKFGGRSFLEEYARRTYPHGNPTQLASDDDDLSRRTEWTTLLLLGLMHTIGRAKPGHHRQFIAKCDTEGWLQMFAASEQDSDRWMTFVADYLERQIDEAEYFHWMRQFVGIFQMSRYLDDYIELFLAIDRIDRPFQLTEVIHSRSSSLFQGGGISAPPLSRVLGLGACFVVRELVRLSVLSNEHATNHCFVPVKRVRDVFERLGCDDLDLQVQRWDMSTFMYRFIVDHIGTERATFWNDFDIPFQFISEDDDLSRKFFHSSVPDDAGDDETDFGELVY